MSTEQEVIISPITIHESEVRTVCIDYSRRLGSGETLTAVTVVSTTPSGLTVSASINGATFTDKDGSTVAANKGVVLVLSTGTARVQYDVVVKPTNSNGTEYPAITVPVWVVS